MEFNTFLLFTFTTLVVVFSPGPAAITVTSQGSGNGVRRAQFGILGIASANVVYFALSATGIASIIIASNTAFTIIKWVGVAYLSYLGVTALLSKSGGLVVEQGQRDSSRVLFAKGFVVEFANPKALLYFAAILPQFINLDLPILPQIAIMGLTTLVLDVVIYSVYAYLGQTLSQSGLKSWVVRSINGVAGSALLFAAFRMVRVTN